MSTYTPKIVISQFRNMDKVRSDNANREIQLLIEKGLMSQEQETEEPIDGYIMPSPQR